MTGPVSPALGICDLSQSCKKFGEISQEIRNFDSTWISARKQCEGFVYTQVSFAVISETAKLMTFSKIL